MNNRMKRIKSKGFAMEVQRDDAMLSEQYIPTDFSKIRVGMKTLADATLANVGSYKRINPRLGDKEYVLEAINRMNTEKMREISEYFFRSSGIYHRLCCYMAFIYRYDWVITPYINGGGGYDGDLSITSNIDDKARDKAVSTFFNAVHMIDAFEVKKVFGRIALQVLRLGCYYGYIVTNNGIPTLQDLPINYCRSRYNVNGQPAVEFNMKYFDDKFSNTEQRTRILNLFPDDFKKGYRAYKQGRLPGDFPGDESGWWLLDIGSTVKFNLNGEDYPPFISVIPAIIDLDEALDLDKKKMAQQLVKIIIQKMPIDKNGDLVFDVDEAQELHNNAVQMLQKAIGIDVLTTFADVEIGDLADKNTTTTSDELKKIERAVFNAAGVSQLQFNSEGNIALNYSRLNDEASMKDLILQFRSFLNRLLTPFNTKPKKLFFIAEILNTTIYNYQELAKQYESEAKLGYSKMLPQIALGQSQSSILANAYFENNILELFMVFIPPMSSNTMNTEAIQNMKHGGDPIETSNGSSNSSGKSDSDGEGAGRPEKADTEKSDKTIQNRESMS